MPGGSGSTAISALRSLLVEGANKCEKSKAGVGKAASAGAGSGGVEGSLEGDAHKRRHVAARCAMLLSFEGRKLCINSLDRVNWCRCFAVPYEKPCGRSSGSVPHGLQRRGWCVLLIVSPHNVSARPTAIVHLWKGFTVVTDNTHHAGLASLRRSATRASRAVSERLPSRNHARIMRPGLCKHEAACARTLLAWVGGQAFFSIRQVRR
jgi:hypothetical protein